MCCALVLIWTVVSLQDVLCSCFDLDCDVSLQDVLCQSLSEESVVLRQRLKETADMCQHLARRLDEKDKPSGSSSLQPQKCDESMQKVREGVRSHPQQK